MCGRCHVGTETAPHILCEYVALDDFRFRRLGKHFLWNQATKKRLRYVRYSTISEVLDYWRNKVDGDVQ
jgi:hypothetical protein